MNEDIYNEKHVKVSGIKFHVPSRYLITENYFLGQGYFGLVVIALDKVTGSNVSIKKLNNKEDLKRKLREITIHRIVKAHPNIINMNNVIYHSDELYVVLKSFDCTLKEFLQFSNQILNTLQIQWITYQMLAGICFMHQMGICHGAISPCTVLLQENCKIKIGDFSSAKYVAAGYNKADEEIEDCYMTRWYREPSFLIHKDSFDYPMDLWSIGCVFAELFSKRPLFPGTCYTNQLQVICKRLGIRSPEEFGTHCRKEVFQLIQRFCGNTEESRISDHLSDVPSNAIEFLEKLLIPDPKKRLTALEAVTSSYFDGLNMIVLDVDLKKMMRPVDETDFAFEPMVLSKHEADVFIHSEISRYKTYKVTSSCFKQQTREYKCSPCDSKD